MELAKNSQGHIEIELVRLANAGDAYALERLFNMYSGLVHYLCRDLYLVGGDKDDLLQVARIGLYEAVMGYEERFLSTKSFKNFAILCIKRQLTSCLIARNRLKHKCLNEAISVDSEYDRCLCNGRTPDDEAKTFVSNTFEDYRSNPENRLLEAETTSELIRVIRSSLTELEMNVLSLRLRGVSYRESSELLGISIKSIDNAMQRIKKKLCNYLKENTA